MRVTVVAKAGVSTALAVPLLGLLLVGGPAFAQVYPPVTVPDAVVPEEDVVEEDVVEEVVPEEEVVLEEEVVPEEVEVEEPEVLERAIARDDRIAVTGSEVVVLALIGLLMLALGTAAIARRRSGQTPSEG